MTRRSLLWCYFRGQSNPHRQQSFSLCCDCSQSQADVKQAVNATFFENIGTTIVKYDGVPRPGGQRKWSVCLFRGGSIGAVSQKFDTLVAARNAVHSTHRKHF